MADNNENNPFEQNNSDDKLVDYASLYTSDPFSVSGFTTGSIEKKETRDTKKSRETKESNDTKEPKTTSDSVYYSGDSVYIGQESKVSIDSSDSIYGSSSSSIYGSSSTESIYGKQSTESIYGNYSTNPVYGEKNSVYQAYVDPSQGKDKLLPLAIIALVFGILGFCCNLFTLFVCNLVAIILGILYLCLGKDNPNKNHKPMAIASIILAGVGILIGIGLVVWVEYDDYKISNSEPEYVYTSEPGDNSGTTDTYVDPYYVVPDEYSSVERSDDPVVDAYIEYFIDVAKKNQLIDSRFIGTAFDTISSNSTVITMYNFPTSDCWVSFTISHYFNEDVYPYVVDGFLRDKTKEYEQFDFYGKMTGTSGENYRLDYSVADSGYVIMNGVLPDEKVTIEAKAHFEKKETREKVLEMFKSYKEDINWPDIK